MREGLHMGETEVFEIQRGPVYKRPVPTEPVQESGKVSVSEKHETRHSERRGSERREEESASTESTTQLYDKLYGQLRPESRMLPVVKLLEASKHLRTALGSDSPLVRGDEVELFFGELKALGLLPPPSDCFDKLITALTVALYDHRSREYCDNELIAVLKVVEVATKRPAMEMTTLRDCLRELREAEFSFAGPLSHALPTGDWAKADQEI